MGGLSAFGSEAVPANFVKSPAFLDLDKLSVQDRVDKLGLSNEEILILKATLSTVAMEDFEHLALSEIVRWFALAGGSLSAMGNVSSKWKLKDGQASLARAIFDDAYSTGKLSYKFSVSVIAIKEDGDTVTVSSAHGKQYKGRHVICAAPLLMLKHIKFEPPLETTKAEAISEGHHNMMVKLYAEVKGRQWRNWQCYSDSKSSYPFMNGEGFSPDGQNSLIFHTLSNKWGEPEQDPEAAVQLVEGLHPDLVVVRLVSLREYSLLRLSLTPFSHSSAMTGAVTPSREVAGCMQDQISQRNIWRVCKGRMVMCISQMLTGQTYGVAILMVPSSVGNGLPGL